MGSDPLTESLRWSSTVCGGPTPATGVKGVRPPYEVLKVVVDGMRGSDPGGGRRRAALLKLNSGGTAWKNM